jgi:hypothetical protein
MKTNSKNCCIREAKDVVHEENQFITEAEYLDHEEKVNKYQGMLAARLKAKYFSGEAFDEGTTSLHLAFPVE